MLASVQATNLVFILTGLIFQSHSSMGWVREPLQIAEAEIYASNNKYLHRSLPENTD